MLVRGGQRVAGPVLGPVQEVADDERGGADDELRARVGVVLLDLDHGGRGPVELEGRDGGGRAAEADVGARFQLLDRRAGFLRFEREFLTF